MTLQPSTPMWWHSIGLCHAPPNTTEDPAHLLSDVESLRITRFFSKLLVH